MRTLGVDKIVELQKKTNNIRNICILAHVDHGKTTLADTLVASNGIISQRMAGKLRYLDSREDEQVRGITMKSSAISLIYNKDETDILINLIDSPGHIDFSSEVSTAVRLCDGAIVVVDVVEGVCPQTYAVLRQAWLENIKPVLVLNKIDRLITELKMSPLEAHIHLQQILEQVNAITGELFTSEVLEKTSTKTDDQSASQEDTPLINEQVYDWSSGLEETDDSNLYFSPDQGNVIFASAIDGWGFGISHFAEMFAAKLGVSANVLLKTLWGDYYLENKTKRIKKGAQQKAKKPLFVNFILENLWSVYETVLENRDKEKIEKIVKSLNLKIPPRDARHGDPRVHLQAICSQWLPLSKAVLAMVVDKLPSPLNMEPERAEKLLCSRARRFDTLPQETQKLKQDFLSCSAEDEAPVVVYVSKLFPVERKHLPQHKQRPLTQQQITERRELARKRHAEKMAAMTGDVADEKKDEIKQDDANKEGSSELIIVPKNSSESPDDQVFVAFARVYSGTVRKHQKLLVLGPKHDPVKALAEDEEAEKYMTEFVVEDLYLFMGRELEALDSVSAGNILGLGGLEEHILKSATISNLVACPAFTDMYFEAAPIVRVAVEPVNAADIPKLEMGLKLLNQADPCVEILIQENGEQVIIGAGEVHLQKCLDDLRNKYAKVEVNVSDPIVAFRESIIPVPKFDRLNEAIIDQNPTVFRDKEIEDGGEESDDDDEEVLERGLVEIQTANRLCGLKIRAVPLPPDVVEVLESHADLIKVLNQYSASKYEKNTRLLNVQTKEDLIKFKTKLDEALQNCKDEDKILNSAIDQIWCFGPRKNGPNILLNKIPGYNRPSIWNCLNGSQNGCKTVLREIDYCIASGFQMATLSGPLCEEPMHGVCFIIEGWEHYDKPMSLKERYKLRKEALAQKLKKEESMKRVDSSGSLNGGKNITKLNEVEKSEIETSASLTDIDSAMAEVKLVNDSTQSSDKLSVNSISQSETQLEDCDRTAGVNIDSTAENLSGYVDAASSLERALSSPDDEISPAWEQGPSNRDVYGPFSGQLMSCMKEGCRRAFQSQPQRLMWAMYTCVIQATSEVLGKMYAVLSKRHGRILHEEMKEGSSVFNIKAVLPVVESFGFAEDIRKRTSGLASPQLKFSHWEIIDLDPFWVPTTEEEYMHFGEKADSENIARKYMNSVRRRKGLPTDDKLVEFAEKQRTLKKNK